MVTMVNFLIVLFVIGFCNCISNTIDGPGSTADPVPDDGYSPSLSGRLYKLHVDRLPWGEADKVCEREGGHLAVIHSEAESSYLTQLLKDAQLPTNLSLALLGYSRFSDQEFTTITGTSLSSTGFQRMSEIGPESRGVKGGNCGSLQLDGGIGRSPCQDPVPYICQRPTGTETTTTPAVPSRPATGYQLVAGLGWYKVHRDRRKWHDALRACEAEGTHLAILNSDSEAKALKLLMSRQRGINYGPCGCAFIGFHDLSTEGHFITVFGEPLESTGFTTWGPGNPSNSGYNEDCGSITYRGDLNDLNCDEEYPFICEHSTNTLSYNTTNNTHAIFYRSLYETYPGIGSYKLHTDGKVWSEAKEVCEKEGAALAVVNSEAESDVIRKLIGRNPDLELADGDSVFIGFTGLDGNETTVFGQKLDEVGFTRWGESKAVRSLFNNMCGGLNRRGGLVQVNCLFRAPFVCEKITTTTNSSVLQALQVAPASYKVEGGLGYYRLSVVRATWHEAKAICEGEDAHLAILNSDTESEMMQNMVARHPDNVNLTASIFLGFHDQTTEGRFETVLGTPLDDTGFNKWAAWNPDNFGRGEDCGAMDKEGYLNDVPCDMRLPFICERELNYTSARNAYNAPNRLTVDPEHIHVKEGGRVYIRCTSDEPLIECHFKTTNGDLYDLSRSHLSQDTAGRPGGYISSYSYSGKGLEHGDCGMIFYLSPRLHRFMIGCRGRSLHGGWKYGYTSVHGSNAASMPIVRLSASEVVVQNTTEPLRLLWQTPTPITTCKCILPSQSMETQLSDQNETAEQSSASVSSSYEDDDSLLFGNLRPSLSSDSPVRYYGQGFKTGQCGIELRNPSEWNGYIWCGMGSARGWEWRSAAIIVAKPPVAPVLVVHASEHSEGAILEAECRVGPSRPTSNITWYLGDEMIRQDNENDSPSMVWAWSPDEQWITQKIARQLRAGDRGKMLTCEAGHTALPSGTIRTSLPVNLEGSVLNRTFDVEEHGFEAGKAGYILIEIAGSPKPDITWHFDNVTIKGGGQDSTGRFVAAPLTEVHPLGITWLAKLFITNVTEEDFSRDFYLTSKNEFGAQAYKVVILRGRTTVPPTTTTTTSTTTQSTTTTRGSSSTEDDSATTTEASAAATGGETTQYPAQSEEPLLEGKAPTPDTQTSWATGEAITGIVIAFLIIHLTLAAIFIYGRRSGWRFLPVKARRRFLPAMSMDNLLNEET